MDKLRYTSWGKLTGKMSISCEKIAQKFVGSYAHVVHIFSPKLVYGDFSHCGRGNCGQAITMLAARFYTPNLPKIHLFCRVFSPLSTRPITITTIYI